MIDNIEKPVITDKYIRDFIKVHNERVNKRLNEAKEIHFKRRSSRIVKRTVNILSPLEY